MATKEGTRASAEFMCICLAPDVCKSPTIPVPYKILSLFDCAVNFSTNVRFRTQFAFRHNSRLSTVRCDEVGVGGGVLSGVNMGFCRPIPTTHSKTVRVNGSFVDYHVGTYMFMNCAGPEGPFNTIGQVIFLGNMLPGPVSPSGKIPKGCICGDSGILSDIQSSLGDADDLIKKGKMLYSLATTDWSDPSAVLGAIGGVAGIAGLQDVAKYAGQAKELHDTGKKLLNTDFSDPLQALGAVAGLGNIPGMSDVSKIAGLASTIGNTIKTDWSDPQAALAAATNIMKSTGLNQMAAQMLSNAILDSNIPVTQSGTTPPFFPKPGAANNGNGSSSGTSSASNSASTSGSSSSKQSAIPPSSDGKPRQHITPDVLDYLKQTNTAAYERYNLLSDSDKANAFVEMGPPSKDSNGSDYSPNDRTAIYIPGEGFSTSKEERDSLPNVSQYIPSRIRELFVADKQDATQGNFFGIKEKEGNVYLFGGLIDLGSPELPGAGNTQAWWVPDRILNMDMSPYYDHHDKGYYGSNVGLKDLGNILSHELEAFKAGATLNPLQLPLQAIYSAATTAVGLGTAVTNEATKIGSGDFSSLKDFFGSVFGGSSVNPIDSQIMTIAPGGCMGPEVPTLPGQSAPGTGSGAPGSGAPPKPGTAGAPDGNASGAGKDGMLVTTAPGNPAAVAAAIEAQFRKDNQAALAKAQAEEKAAQENAAQEKAAKEKASKEKSSQAKLNQSEMTQDESPKGPDSITLPWEDKDKTKNSCTPDDEKSKYYAQLMTKTAKNVDGHDQMNPITPGHAQVAIGVEDADLQMSRVETYGAEPRVGTTDNFIKKDENLLKKGGGDDSANYPYGTGHDIRVNHPEDFPSKETFPFQTDPVEIPKGNYEDFKDFTRKFGDYQVFSSNCVDYAVDAYGHATGSSQFGAISEYGISSPRELGKDINESKGIHEIRTHPTPNPQPVPPPESASSSSDSQKAPSQIPEPKPGPKPTF